MIFPLEMHDIGNRIFAKKNVLWVIEKFPKKETKMKENLNKITNAISQRGVYALSDVVTFW